MFGIITALQRNNLSRKVYDDYINKKEQVHNKLCNVRMAFDKYNLISGLHTYLSEKMIPSNLLPPLSLLDDLDKKALEELNKLDFNYKLLSNLIYETYKFLKSW